MYSGLIFKTKLQLQKLIQQTLYRLKLLDDISKSAFAKLINEASGEIPSADAECNIWLMALIFISKSGFYSI